MKIQILHNSLVKDTFIYTATDVIGKAMSFVLIPFISYYLIPEELGLATNFTVLTSILILLAGVAIVNSIPYFFYEQNKDESNALVSNLLLLAIAASLVICVAIGLFSSLIEKYLQLDIYIQFLAVLYVLSSLICQTNLILYRLDDKPQSFAIFQIIQIVLHALVVLLFVIGLKGGGYGKIYAEVLVFFIMGIVHFYMLKKRGYLQFRINVEWIKKLLKFGLPLLPHSLSFWFKSGTDKIFITTFCGLHFNGLYSMAISISSLYTMLVNSFFNAYTPYLQKRLAKLTPATEKNEKISIVKQTYLIYLLFLAVAVAAIAGAWLIFNYLIDIKYLQAFDYFIIIIVANYIYTFYSFVINYIYKEKKTLIMGVITFTGSLVQMLLSYFMIKELGVMGAVYSLLIGNLIITIGIFFYSNVVYPMPWLSFLSKK